MADWVQVWNETKKVVVCEKCLVAKTWWQRLIGLMGRKSLGRDEGLLLTHASGGIHTCFMRFPIDVAYLNRDGLIVAVRHNMKPWQVWILAKKDAVMALELPAGRLAETGTEVGDLLTFQPNQFGSPK
ncbi:MAG: DUF192 domain-containing protein [Armatimonadota bacterium]|nr:DUF192 domain-containing protein [Armatimonadota bacterium]MCX7642606.1 DUF192 domain-containing protein [Armatimonadota bacterium]MDW8143156.1 DUF192 domain-containing protein [Armatimonadota bacterium]